MPGAATLAERPLDVLVVGGGVIGAAAAREAALRGLAVGLAEAGDVGRGTTAGTTRLAHGGLRYLEHYDLAQVREGLHERHWLLGAAPHLVVPLPFLMPLPPRRPLLHAQLRAGLALYDGLSPPGLPRHAFLGKEEALREEPRLRPDGMAGAAAFHDAQVLLPERLVVEYLRAAALAGAAVANHAPVESLARVAGGWRAAVRDADLDRAVEVRARVVLNCAGPWVGQLAGLAGVARPLARTTRGTHVAFPGPLQRALILRAGDDRTFFALPWNEVTLVGTTDLDEPGDPGAALPTAEEVAYLLREAAPFVDLAGAPCYTTVGVRAMLRQEGVAPGAVPRRHQVLDHEADGCPGLLTVAGGKMTTARAVASDLLDAACKLLGRALPPAPAGALPGREGHEGAARMLAGAGLDPALRRSLGLLGGRAAKALAEGTAVCPRHATRGALRMAVQEEWCAHLPDFLFRRSLCAHAPDLGAHAAEDVAEAMGELLGWSPAQREAELAAYEAEATRRRAGLPAA